MTAVDLFSKWSLSFRSRPVLSAGKNMGFFLRLLFHNCLCVPCLWAVLPAPHNPWSRPSKQTNYSALAKFRPSVLISSSRQLISVPRTINCISPFCPNCTAAAYQQRWARAHCRCRPSEPMAVTSCWPDTSHSQPQNPLLSGDAKGEVLIHSAYSDVHPTSMKIHVSHIVLYHLRVKI